MKTLKTRLNFGAVVVCSLMAVSTASANIIPVANPSFEILPPGGLPFAGCGAGCSYSIDAIPGWLNAGFSGQFQPGTQAGNFAYFSTLSDGITSTYTDSGSITQTVGATVQAGVTYTLLIDLGTRNDFGFGASADLLVNGTQYLAVGVPASPGNWATFTATYIGLPADAGSSITIELNHPFGSQGNFDNVRLSDSLTSSVPEPASSWLLALGLAPILKRLSRRKRV